MTSTDPARTLTARTPEDVLAIVPVVLGFTPTDSVVMLTFGGTRSLHARVDLPTELDQLAGVAAALAEPAHRHLARGAVLVLYTADAELARQALAVLATTFAAAGVEVVAVLRADGRRWWRLSPRPEDPSEEGTRYQVASHRFVVESVVAGEVIHPSRSALAATLRQGDPELIEDVAEAIDRHLSAGGGGPRRVELAWAAAAVDAHAESTRPPDARVTARLLVDLQDPALCEAVLDRIGAAQARGHVGLWTHVVSHAPEHLVGAPAAVLAFAAWRAGNGALAWCAVDRCAEAAPDHPVAELLSELLEHAVAPADWAEVRS